ncbi:MAG: hypothetical protein ACFFGP_16245 [Promethearchaeota archaeon]
MSRQRKSDHGATDVSAGLSYCKTGARLQGFWPTSVAPCIF